MKHIVQLPAEKKPRDDEYHFTERAQKLIDAWNPKGSDSKSNGDAKTAEVTDGTAAMNLNGTATPAAEEDAKGEADADAPAEVDTEKVGDESMLADVTMSAMSGWRAPSAASHQCPATDIITAML
ncbi:hypothetical protein EV715DRAFT_297621 [Schizophyllum commune]